LKDFRSLKVWQKAHELTLLAYKSTLSFPWQESYGLVSQLRRATSSIAANIAEGCGCDGSREFARFLEIALRSVSETEYGLLTRLSLNPSVTLSETKGLVGGDSSLALRMTIVGESFTGLIQRLNAE
jgi:four helix bundle protein